MFGLEPCGSAAGSKRKREYSQDSSGDASTHIYPQYQDQWDPSKARRVEVRYSVSCQQSKLRFPSTIGCYQHQLESALVRALGGQQTTTVSPSPTDQPELTVSCELAGSSALRPCAAVLLGLTVTGNDQHRAVVTSAVFPQQLG